jgi:hypothetical protein
MGCFKKYNHHHSDDGGRVLDDMSLRDPADCPNVMDPNDCPSFIDDMRYEKGSYPNRDKYRCHSCGICGD